MIERVRIITILLIFFYVTMYSQWRRTKLDSAQILPPPKYMIHINSFFATHAIREINLSDSMVGRSTLYFINATTGLRIYKSLSGGLKTQYYLYHSTLFNASRINYRDGVYAGIWLGISYLNHKDNFFGMVTAHTGFNSIRMLNEKGLSNIIVSDRLYHDYGMELNGGIRVSKCAFVTVGLQLNNFLTRDSELNHFQMGVLLYGPTPKKKERSVIKIKSVPSY